MAAPQWYNLGIMKVTAGQNTLSDDYRVSGFVVGEH